MRGRKPDPTSFRLLKGNPGKRPLNGDEPEPAPLTDTSVPADLHDARARAEWERIVGGLVATGQVTTVDRGMLLAYCLKYGQWLALEDEARKHPLIVKGSLGNPIANPAIRLANQTLDLVVRTASELGITPASRSRVHAQPAAPAASSKWAGALP